MSGPKSSSQALTGEETTPSGYGGKRRRTARATNVQIETLIGALERQTSLANRRFTGLQGRENYESGWKELASELNNIPNGAYKTPDQWITVWRDIKSRACSKASKLNRNIRETGNRELNVPLLTEVEKRVISLVGVDYTIGTNCPDSMPADEMIQHEVETGGIVENFLNIPQCSDVESELIVMDPSMPAEEIEVEIINTQPPSSQLTTINTATAQDSPQHVPSRRNRNLNPRRSVAEQQNTARAEFLAVAQSNADAMNMLAAAAKQQAEAAKIQAEASLLLAQAANKIGDALLKFVDKYK